MKLSEFLNASPANDDTLFISSQHLLLEVKKALQDLAYFRVVTKRAKLSDQELRDRGGVMALLRVILRNCLLVVGLNRIGPSRS